LSAQSLGFDHVEAQLHGAGLDRGGGEDAPAADGGIGSGEDRTDAVLGFGEGLESGHCGIRGSGEDDIHAMDSTGSPPGHSDRGSSMRTRTCGCFFAERDAIISATRVPTRSPAEIGYAATAR